MLGNILWRMTAPAAMAVFQRSLIEAGARAFIHGRAWRSAITITNLDLDFYFSDMVNAWCAAEPGRAPLRIWRKRRRGVGQQRVGWGTVFFDYDNDSWPDLYSSHRNSSVRYFSGPKAKSCKYREFLSRIAATNFR